jgi:hypothetical protein
MGTGSEINLTENLMNIYLPSFGHTKTIVTETKSDAYLLHESYE